MDYNNITISIKSKNKQITIRINGKLLLLLGQAKDGDGDVPVRKVKQPGLRKDKNYWGVGQSKEV